MSIKQCKDAQIVRVPVGNTYYFITLSWAESNRPIVACSTYIMKATLWL
jgi:hypothetical protein